MGRRRKSIALHLLHGTYRPGRHGPIPNDGPPAVVRPARVYDWAPTEAELSRLGPHGRAFVDRWLQEQEVNFSAGHLLLCAADVLDTAMACRQDIDTRGFMVATRRGGQRMNPSVAQHLRYSRLLGRLLKQLNDTIGGTI